MTISPHNFMSICIEQADYYRMRFFFNFIFGIFMPIC